MITKPGSIFFGLAIVSTVIVISVKLLSVFVHGPEVKKLSLKATLAESSNESAFQLIFVAIISLWAKDVTETGVMSMVSSLMMIGKAAAESHLTFGPRNELENVPLKKHIALLATISPVFILTAAFRIGSLAIILAWNWQMGLLIILPFAAAFFLVAVVFLKKKNSGCCGKYENLEKLSLGDVFSSYCAELSTTSNWGHLGREKSRKLQVGVAAYYIIVYTIALLPIVISPTNTWFDPVIVYHPDPATLRAAGIVALISGIAAFILQMLLPKILKFHDKPS